MKNWTEWHHAVPRKMGGWLALVVACLFVAGGVVEDCHAGTPRVKVKVSRKKDHKLSGFSYDNLDQMITLTVKLHNQTMTPVEGMKLRFLIIGKCYGSRIPIREDVYIVLVDETKKVNLDGAERKEIEIGPWVSEYDRTDSVRSGAAYEGYALILKDADGEAFIYDTDRSRMLRDKKDYEKLLSFRPLVETFDGNLKKSEYKPEHLDVEKAE